MPDSEKRAADDFVAIAKFRAQIRRHEADEPVALDYAEEQRKAWEDLGDHCLVSLHMGYPEGPDGSAINECDYPGYCRQTIARGPGPWEHKTWSVLFPSCTQTLEAPQRITHVALSDPAGHVLFYYELDPPGAIGYIGEGPTVTYAM